MAVRRRARGALVTLLAAAVLFSGMAAAYAAEDTQPVQTEEYDEYGEFGAAFLKSDIPDNTDVDIINFKAKLNELGFYSAGVSDEVLQSKELDDLTMAAVKLVCKLNPEYEYHEDGVENVLYWRVMGMGDATEPLVTPTDEEYPPLMPGDRGEGVERIQNRLNQLGYDAVAVFAPGVYDDALQKAVDEFVRCNKLVYDPDDGIPTSLQEALFQEDAQPYVSSQGFGGRVLAYVRGSSAMFGLQVPNAVVLLVGFIFLCVIAVLIVKLASPSGGKEEAGDTDCVRFVVEYGGESFVHKVPKGAVVRIGRGVGDFPLNTADKSVSREHCEIRPEAGGLVLRDMSSFGTKINGVLCHQSSQALRPGDVIEIGKHTIKIQF